MLHFYIIYYILSWSTPLVDSITLIKDLRLAKAPEKRGNCDSYECDENSNDDGDDDGNDNGNDEGGDD